MLSTIQFTSPGLVRLLGLFHERQAPFEHKPWVESELRGLGIPVIPWTYYSAEEPERILEALIRKPLVVRLSRSFGGSGLTLIDSSQELAPILKGSADGFVAAAPFITPSVPLNVGACVFENGRVTLHPPSVQLIGISGCTKLTFGYCGNDFTAVSSVDRRIINELGAHTQTIGSWLAHMGFRGAFGVDAIVSGDRLFISELNPRFQGSSELSAQIDASLDRPDVYQDHIAAFVGMSPWDQAPLADLRSSGPGLSQVIYHNVTKGAVRLEPPPSARPRTSAEVTLTPSSDIRVEMGAILFKVVFPGQVTDDGHSLRAPVLQTVAEIAPRATEPLQTV
jgi:hypothetical protein